jgi:hypothetical protein
MAEEFDILAAKVLSGEATEAEATHFEHLLAQDRARQVEFTELRASWSTLKELGPLAQALEASPADPPPERLAKWQAEVANRFYSREKATLAAKSVPDAANFTVTKRKRFPATIPLALAAMLVCAALVGSLLLSRRSYGPPAAAPIAYLIVSPQSAEVNREGKLLPVIPAMPLRAGDELKIAAGASATLISSNGVLSLKGPLNAFAADLTLRDKGTNGAISDLETALFGSAKKIDHLLARTRSNVGIAIYSPLGFTENLAPVIMWKSDAGKSYHVSVTDELVRTNPPLRLFRVTSPIEFSRAWPDRSLSADGLYRLRIQATGNGLSATEVTFRTLAQATPRPSIEPSARLLAAYEMLAASPACIGDALALLLSLPHDMADSEFAARMKLFAFGQFGYSDDFQSVAAKLRRDPPTK